MGLTILKQYIDSDIKILFLYVFDTQNYLYIRPIAETRAYENVTDTCLYLDDAFFEEMKITNQKLSKDYKIKNYVIPFLNDFSFERDDLIIYNENKLFVDLYTKIIYHLKTKHYDIVINKTKFNLFYKKVLDLYLKDKYLIIDFKILYVYDNEMLLKLDFVFNNKIQSEENIIFKNEIDIFDKDILINKPQIKNIYFCSLQDLDLYYYFNKDLFVVSRSTFNKNDDLEEILKIGSGHHNGFYFRRVE